MRNPRARILAMNEPDVTCGGPDGRRLLAFGLHAAAFAAPGAFAAPAVSGVRAARNADGWPGAAAAAAAPSTRAQVASTASRARGQDPPASGGCVLTGTPPAGGSGPRCSLP